MIYLSNVCVVSYHLYKKDKSSNKRCHFFFIMITRGDVQRVIDAFILKESLYWWLHPIERVQTVRGNDAWDGYHWTLARQLAQDREWMSLKAYMDTMGESYLRECMQHLIQSASPRLYREYWTVCREEEEKENP